MKKLAVFVLVFVAAFYVSAQRQKFLLDGVWKFAALDDKGTVIQSGDIKVPGIWEAHGYGKPTDKLNFQHIGTGRYETEFTVPETLGDMDVFFVIGGVSRYAKVWIDGESVGAEAIGFVGSHSWNVSKLLKPAKKTKIRIDVDSKQRLEIDAMLGAAQLNDYMHAAWGGLFGHVYLEALPKTRIADAYVSTRVFPKPSLSVDADFEGDGLDGAELKICVVDSEGKILGSSVQKLSADSKKAKISCLLENAKLWSPESPNLCTVKMELSKNGTVLDSRSVRTGIREIKIDGNKFIMNGSRLYLRGYGDDHIYLKEIAMPADKSVYLDRLRQIKALGFNHVRHHSTILPDEYYEACDEVGIMPNAEFPIGYPAQFPNSKSWKRDTKGMGDAERSFKIYAERFERVVRELRNHVCIFAWCGGNELFMVPDEGIPRNVPIMSEFKRIVNSLDADRFFIDTDGEWDHYILKPENDRSTLDFCYVLFDEFKDCFIFPEKHATRVYSKGKAPIKPILSHETGNYTTFARPSILPAFKGSPFKPFWLEKSAENLRAAKRLEEAEKWASASEKLYLLMHKYNIEDIRKNPDISGYHWWLIQDYWTSTDGIFDVDFKMKKGIEPSEILKFNSPVVVLQNGMEKIYESGNLLEAEIIVSNYSDTDVSGNFIASVELDGREIYSKSFSVLVPRGEQLKIGEVKTSALPNAERPQPLRLLVKSADGKYENDWYVRLMPSGTKPSADVRVYTDSQSECKVPMRWNLSNVPNGDLDCDAVYIVSRLTPKLYDAMLRGARIVLLDGSQLAISERISFRPVWWRAGGTEYNNRCGTYVSDNPITRDFAPENFCDISWFKLIENGRRYDTRYIPNADNYIRSLSSMLMLKDYTVLCGMKVGKGSLVISGLNHANARNSAENAWIIGRMISGDWLPKAEALPWQLKEFKLWAN